MSVQFSELCNTDRATYFAYLAGVLASYGSSFEQVGLVGWGLGDERLGGGGGCIGESFGVALALGNGERAQGVSDVGLCGATSGVGCAVDSGDEVVDEKCRASGYAAGDVGGDGCGDVGCDSDEFSGGSTEDPVGIRYAKVLKTRAYETVASCLPVGVRGVGAVDAGVVAGSKVHVCAGVSGESSGCVRDFFSSSGKSSAKAEKKPRRGKNQRDREKYRQGIDALSWRRSEGAEDKTELQVSLERKWAAQNELAAEKARKDLEYQRARDVDAEARTTRAKLLKATEQSKVAVEKAFATLKSTGNVPGFCETVVSEEGSSPGLTDGCTISPDSSASMHEFRECQKKNLDLEAEVAKLKRRIEYGKLAAGEEAAFTVHSDGDVSEEVKVEIEKNKSDFFDVELRNDGFEDEKICTLFAKRVGIPSADDYLYDNY